jgi:dCTP deaminase
MSFWSSQTLKSRLPNLIEPFDNNRIQSASYELCLGDEVYISPLPDTPKNERKTTFLKGQETVAIPPGQFAFLMTFEKVTVPPHAIAFISMKFKPKAKGLINVSGFHVDPGYSGCLIFAVYNAGPLNFHVKRREQLFSIWFADLDSTDECARNQKGYDSIPTEILNVPDLVSSLPYLVKRLDTAEADLAKRQETLVKRLDDMEKKVEAYTFQQAIFIGLFVATVAALFPIVASISTYLLDRYFPSNITNTKPVETFPLPKPSSNTKENQRERKQPAQRVDSVK